jgi:hypothetical protein
MAQVATSTVTDVLAPPGNGGVTRDASSGYLYVPVQTAAGTLTIYRSINAGTSWTAWASFTQTGLAEWSGLAVDGLYGHVAYRVSTTGGGGTDSIWYRRVTLVDTTTMGNGVRVSDLDANGGTAGSTWQGVDIACVRNTNGTQTVALAGARTVGTARYGIQIMTVTVSVVGGVTVNNALISGQRTHVTNGTAPGRSGVVMEIEHNGNGQTGSPPNLWVTWGRTAANTVKLAWTGNGWSGPSSFITIRSGLTAQDSPSARWDGTQWMIAVASPDDTTRVRLYQRNRANTTTVTLDSPAHPQGIIRHVAVSYDPATRNPRLYAIGTGNAQIYWVDYTRATGVWGSWTTVNAATVLGPGEWSTRKGGASGSTRHDLVYGVAGSPNTIQHVQQAAVNTIPADPVWNYAVTPANGQAADVNATLTLAWVFSDPDPSQTQGAYALRRQIGGGTAAWWNATSSTWVASEVFNASATAQVALAAGWGADADAVHTYSVRVQDSLSASSVGYSAALALTPSVKVNPTVTAPTAAQVVTADNLTVTWTVAEQTAFRVQLVDTTTGSTVVHDSGRQTSTNTAYPIPNTLPNGGAYTVNVWTYNLEGLASTVQPRAFTVSYAPPPAAVAVLTPVVAQGWMTVAGTSLTAVGTQPAVVSQDLWRRTKLYPILNTNPDMAGTVTGWTGIGGTLTYSTTQARSAPGSARLVPSGAAADALVRLSTLVDISAWAADGTVVVKGWVRPDTANKSIRLQVDLYDTSSVLLGSVPITYTAVVAGAWQYVRATAVVAATFPTAVKAGMSIGLTGTPAATDAFYADDLSVRRSSADPGTLVRAGLGPQASYNDWQAPGATDLEYRWVTKGANGTTLTGPWMG